MTTVAVEVGVVVVLMVVVVVVAAAAATTRVVYARVVPVCDQCLRGR